MKYRILFPLVLILPVLVNAQLKIKNAEDFKIGTVLRFQKCDTMGITAGSGGENQTWDFSQLKLKSDTNTEWMVLPSATPYADKFPTATQVEKYSDGSFVYVDKEKDQSNLVGYASAYMAIAYPKPVPFAKRPISYKDKCTTNFTDNFAMSGMNFSGSGTATIEADGYGKLILPNKTYKNVLRVKVTQLQMDTIKQYGSVSRMNTITYAWFDGNNTSALFKISYTKSMGYNAASVEYLLSEKNK